MPAPCDSLIARLAAWPATAEARRQPPGWVDDPVLNGLTGAQSAAAAAVDPAVLVALAAQPGDPLANLAAMAAVAPGLGRVLGSWCRLGLAGHERDEVEADLVAEALGALTDLAGAGVDAVVAKAKHRVQNRRRTQWARAERRVTFDETIPLAAKHSLEPGVLAWVVDAYRVGLVSLLCAQVLWAAATGYDTQAAARAFGCSPAAWRQRRRRAAASAVAAGLGGE